MPHGGKPPTTTDGMREQREKVRGYPQTLEEAIQRAKAVERQNHLREQKREEQKEHGDRELSYQKRKRLESYSEFNAFARTGQEDQRKHTYSIQQLRDMPKNTSAKSLGLKEASMQN